MDLICMSNCNCGNSIPRQEEERVSQVCRLDVAEESWGVVANRDIQGGDIIDYDLLPGNIVPMASTLEAAQDTWALVPTSCVLLDAGI